MLSPCRSVADGHIRLNVAGPKRASRVAVPGNSVRRFRDHRLLRSLARSTQRQAGGRAVDRIRDEPFDSRAYPAGPGVCWRDDCVDGRARHPAWPGRPFPISDRAAIIARGADRKYRCVCGPRSFPGSVAPAGRLEDLSARYCSLRGCNRSRSRVCRCFRDRPPGRPS